MEEKEASTDLVFFDEECPICFLPYREKAIITCGHQFCFKCVITWSDQENSCPLCKMKFTALRKIVRILDENNVAQDRIISTKRIAHKKQRAPEMTFLQTLKLSLQEFEQFQFDLEMEEAEEWIVEDEFYSPADDTVPFDNLDALEQSLADLHRHRERRHHHTSANTAHRKTKRRKRPSVAIEDIGPVREEYARHTHDARPTRASVAEQPLTRIDLVDEVQHHYSLRVRRPRAQPHKDDCETDFEKLDLIDDDASHVTGVNNTNVSHVTSVNTNVIHQPGELNAPLTVRATVTTIDLPVQEYADQIGCHDLSQSSDDEQDDLIEAMLQRPPVPLDREEKTHDADTSASVPVPVSERVTEDTAQPVKVREHPQPAGEVTKLLSTRPDTVAVNNTNQDASITQPHVPVTNGTEKRVPSTDLPPPPLSAKKTPSIDMPPPLSAKKTPGIRSPKRKLLDESVAVKSPSNKTKIKELAVAVSDRPSRAKAQILTKLKVAEHVAAAPSEPSGANVTHTAASQTNDSPPKERVRTILAGRKSKAKKVRTLNKIEKTTSANSNSNAIVNGNTENPVPDTTVIDRERLAKVNFKIKKIAPAPVTGTDTAESSGQSENSGHGLDSTVESVAEPAVTPVTPVTPVTCSKPEEVATATADHVPVTRDPVVNSRVSEAAVLSEPRTGTALDHYGEHYDNRELEEGEVYWPEDPTEDHVSARRDFTGSNNYSRGQYSDYTEYSRHYDHTANNTTRHTGHYDHNNSYRSHRGYHTQYDSRDGHYSYHNSDRGRGGRPFNSESRPERGGLTTRGRYTDTMRLLPQPPREQYTDRHDDRGQDYHRGLQVPACQLPPPMLNPYMPPIPLPPPVVRNARDQYTDRPHDDRGYYQRPGLAPGTLAPPPMHPSYVHQPPRHIPVHGLAFQAPLQPPRDFSPHPMSVHMHHGLAPNSVVQQIKSTVGTSVDIDQHGTNMLIETEQPVSAAIAVTENETRDGDSFYHRRASKKKTSDAPCSDTPAITGQPIKAEVSAASSVKPEPPTEPAPVPSVKIEPVSDELRTRKRTRSRSPSSERSVKRARTETGTNLADVTPSSGDSSRHRRDRERDTERKSKDRDTRKSSREKDKHRDKHKSRRRDKDKSHRDKDKKSHCHNEKSRDKDREPDTDQRAANEHAPSSTHDRASEADLVKDEQNAPQPPVLHSPIVKPTTGAKKRVLRSQIYTPK